MSHDTRPILAVVLVFVALGISACARSEAAEAVIVTHGPAATPRVTQCVSTCSRGERAAIIGGYLRQTTPGCQASWQGVD
jgi:hypothetical protein